MGVMIKSLSKQKRCLAMSKRLNRLMFLLILMMFVSGCATTYASDYCLIASEPNYTAQDVDVISDELAVWVLQSQETYSKLCK